MNILINGVGGPTPRSIARSLQRSPLDVRLIGTDCNALAHGLYQAELYANTYLIPPASHENYWPEIKSIIQKEDIDLALVQPELEVLAWAKYKQTQNSLPCPALLPDYKLIKVLLDKSIMTELLEDTDWVPPTVTIDPRNVDEQQLENTLGYPFWIRSVSGSSGLGSLKVENRETLATWFTLNQKVDTFMASPFLPGRNLACKLLYFEGNLLRSACAERVNYIMSKVAPSGITGNTSFGRLLNEPALVELSSQAMDHLFEKTGTPKHGFFTVDLKEAADGTPLITEINVRHVAFTGCFAAGGANFITDTVQLLTNPTDFDHHYRMYEFEPGLIFLRDVDAEPVVIPEGDLKK